MTSLLQTGFGMFSARVGRCCPGGDEKRFLITSLALGNNKLRELVAHASSVRQRIASLQAKADAFRIDCEKALSQ